MSKYKSGDVVVVNFPNDDVNNPGTKPRPGVILEALPDTYYLITCITKTDWTGIHKGILVKKDSKIGRVMRLREDSYINIEDTKALPESHIKYLMGTCTIMYQLEKLRNELKPQP